MQSSSSAGSAGTKAAFYRQICEQLSELLGTETNPGGTLGLIANAANTSALLFQLLPDVNWAGFYLADNEQLVLGPFQGKPACTRIPFGKGVCGTAAESGETVVVPDVHQFAGHIACDRDSQSEIVVPLMSWGKVVGVLDVDSPSLNRFDEEDKDGLESVAAVFLAANPSGDMPDFTREIGQSAQ